MTLEQAKPGILRGAKKTAGKRLATLTATIVGRFATWRKGQKVLVLPLNGASRYVIERRKWKGVLPLMNQCCGVPRSAFAFDTQQEATYAARRRRAALRVGSQWVFFRDGDKACKDPWSSLVIRIVEAKVDARGKMLLKAECTQPKHVRPGARRVSAVRRVRYSELW